MSTTQQKTWQPFSLYDNLITKVLRQCTRVSDGAMVQWLVQLLAEQKVLGSIPALPLCFFSPQVQDGGKTLGPVNLKLNFVSTLRNKTISNALSLLADNRLKCAQSGDSLLKQARQLRYKTELMKFISNMTTELTEQQKLKGGVQRIHAYR